MTVEAYVPPKVWRLARGTAAPLRRSIGRRRERRTRRSSQGAPPDPALLQGTWNGMKVTNPAGGAPGPRYQGGRVRRLARRHLQGRPIRIGLRRSQPELQDPRTRRLRRRAAGPHVRIGAPSSSISRSGSGASSQATSRPAWNACPGCSGRWAARRYLGGGFAHFYRYAPVKLDIPLTGMRWR